MPFAKKTLTYTARNREETPQFYRCIPDDHRQWMLCTANVCAGDTSVLRLGCGVNRILFSCIRLWLRTSWVDLEWPRDGGMYLRAFLGIWRTQLEGKCILVDEIKTVRITLEKIYWQATMAVIPHVHFIRGLIVTSEKHTFSRQSATFRWIVGNT